MYIYIVIYIVIYIDIYIVIYIVVCIYIYIYNDSSQRRNYSGDCIDSCRPSSDARHLKPKPESLKLPISSFIRAPALNVGV